MSVDQYEMKRTQRVVFTPEQAEKINKAMDFIEHFGGNVTPNKFIKHATVKEAKEINEVKK